MPQPEHNPGTDTETMTSSLKYLVFRPILLGLAGLSLCLAAPALALETFDFESPYLVQSGQQVWDFSLIEDGGQYHVFYHTIPQQAANPAYADTIWHATSPDLRHWNMQGAALTVGPDWYDSVAMWAPDVVYDEASGRWAMLYTGVTTGMVQRPCLAWSDDLNTWTKSLANPVFEPDSLTYHWAPTQAWSSFRDPFVYHDGAQWNMLSTAGLRLGGYPGYRRGIVHRATSADLVNWVDAGVFYEHDGSSGKTRDLESVQYLVRDGWHHLFFVEQNLDIDNHPTNHMVATDPSGWTMANTTVVDAGWAPEIRRFDAGADADIFARLAKDQDPRDGSWFVTVKFDSIRFENGGQTPVVIVGDGLADDWPVRLGASGMAAPAFGENAELRGDVALGIEGHGWFSSLENYGGPLAGLGAPGAELGTAATGRLESRAFTVSGGHLRLLLGGGYYPETCYIALLDDFTGVELARTSPTSPTRMSEQFWDLGPWLGQTVRLAIVDNEEGPNGWIAVDGIEERLGGLAGVGENTPRGVPIDGLEVWPNPFNPRTVIRFEMARAGAYRVDVFDLAGRRVWRSAPGVMSSGGEVRVAWDGRDQNGRALASGAFLGRVMVDEVAVGQVRLMLLK